MVVAFLLDTLIQAKAVLPTSELMQFYEDYPDEVLTLIAYDQNRSIDTVLSLLIRAEREGNAPRWLLLSTLFGGGYFRPFEEHLLDGLLFYFKIEIVEGNYLPVLKPRSGWGVFGGIPGGVLGPVQWPALPGQYCLSVSPEPGDTVMSTTGPVFLRRYVNRQNTCSSEWKTDRSELAVGILTTFFPSAFFWPDFPLLKGGKATIIWQGPEKTRITIQEAKSQFFQSCRDLLLARQKRNMPTRSWSDAELRSRIVVTVSDLRTDKKIPIPSN